MSKHSSVSLSQYASRPRGCSLPYPDLSLLRAFTPSQIVRQSKRVAEEVAVGVAIEAASVKCNEGGGSGGEW